MKVLRTFLLLLIGCLSTQVSARLGGFEYNHIQYSVIKDGETYTSNVRLTSFTSEYSGNFEIPEYIDFYDESDGGTYRYYVTEIGQLSGGGVYSNNDHLKTLTSITIPSHIKKLHDSCFSGCGENITSVTIQEGVEEIGYGVFMVFNKLTSITLPSTLRYLGVNSFQHCDALESVTIPEGLTRIEKGTFCPCDKLKTVNLPNTITSIGEGAFMNCPLLENINIPTALESIETNAFNNCDAITSIELPGSFRTVGVSAFFDCDNLESVVLNEGATTICNNAFERCHKLSSVTLPSTITTIGNAAFRDCALTSIVLPEGLKAIGNDAFHSNVNLKTANYPAGIETAGCGIFANCGFTSFTIPEGITSVPEYFLASCNKLKEVKLPQSLLEICDYAFSSTPLETLTIPQNVRDIYIRFTIFSSSLKTLVMECTTPPTMHDVNDAAWRNDNGKVVVPLGTLSTYRAAPFWGDKDNNENYLVRNIVEPREDEVTIADGTAYTCTYDVVVDDLKYARRYKNNNWQAWYVPFEMTITQEMATNFSFGKFAGTYTDDEEFFLTVVYLKVGDVMKPHTPYFIKAKMADENNDQIITIGNATLKAAEEMGFTMLSAEKKITIHGIYQSKTATEEDKDWYAYAGGLYRHPNVGTTLSPYRFYMTIEDREDNPYFTTPKPSQVKMMVIGDDETSIEEIDGEVIQLSDAVYDLSGRKVTTRPKKGIYIKKGKKILF